LAIAELANTIPAIANDEFLKKSLLLIDAMIYLFFYI
jgi:hypothetical protein